MNAAAWFALGLLVGIFGMRLWDSYFLRVALLLAILPTTADAGPLRNRAFRGRTPARPTVKYTTAPVPPRPAELTPWMIRVINRTPASRMHTLCPYVPESAAPVLDRIIRDGQVDACARAWGLEVQAARAFAVAWVAYRRKP